MAHTVPDLRIDSTRRMNGILRLFGRDPRSRPPITENHHLVRELTEYLKAVHRILDRKKVPLDQRKVSLGKQRWPKQYRVGIVRCYGIDIEWRDGLV